MKSAIELFSALGRRLADFGGDAPTQEVAERACRANGWFTPADVRRAVAAIADDMLRRDPLVTWPLPRSGRRAAPRAGRHGRQYSAGRLLRLVVRLGRRPSLSGEAFGQGPGADGICRRDAAGA